MNKQTDKTTDSSDDMRDHYEFDYRQAKPNRFAKRINQNSIMVVLDPDVAAVFPTAEAVNEALRVMVQALKQLPQATVAQ